MSTGSDQIRDFLVGSRMPPRDAATRELHNRIDDAVDAAANGHGTVAEVDALLAQCQTDECAVCGQIVCPYNEPLHFHHDGCPACDGGTHEET